MSDGFEGYFGTPTKEDIKNLQDNVEFSALLEKNQKTTLDSKLQVARVGGYTKKSVEEFAAEMRQNLQQVKNHLERQIMDLASEKASITQECAVLRTQLKSAVDTLAAKNQGNTQVSGNDDGQYQVLLAQKEAEISRLNEALVNYTNECNILSEENEKLKNMLSDSSDEESAALLQQKNEIERKYNELLQQVDERNLELEEKIRYLDDRENQLEQKNSYLEELQMQLEDEKAYISEAQAQLEENKRKLEDIQLQLEQEKACLTEAQAQLELKNQQALEIQAQLKSEITAREFIGNMMNKEFEFDEDQTMEDWLDNGGGEKLFESLYVHFSQLKGKIEQQQTMIAEKEQLVEQLKVLKNETTALRQENENAKMTITSLRKSFEQVMSEMDEQTETLNLYISRSRKDRDLLKSVLGEKCQDSVAGTNEETGQSNQLEQSEESEDEPVSADEAGAKSYNQVLSFENAKRIIPLNDNGKAAVAEDAEGKDKSMPSLNKAADI